MNCSTSSTTRHLSLHTTGMQQPVQNSTICNCGSSAVSSTSALENCRTCRATSTTLSMYCNWRNSMVIRPRESASAPRQGCQRPCRKNTTSCDCVISTVSHNCARTAGPAQQTSITLSMCCNREELWSDEQQDHGNRPLHPDKKQSTTNDGLQLRRPHSFLQSKPKKPP